MDEDLYVSFYYGDTEKATQQLEKSISLYENSPFKQTEKGKKRIENYKMLLSEIKAKTKH